jgi:hypothetical protein
MKNISHKIADALLDAYDVQRTLLSRNPEALWKPKDNEGTDITVGDCLENIIEILESLDTASLQTK